MAGKHIGYIRVSSIDQNTARQLDGIALDQTFEDKCSGKDTNRPQLQAALKFLRDGDTLHIHSMDRLARSVVDLRGIVEDLTRRNVKVRFEKEGLEFTSETTDPMKHLLLTMLGAVAEFERSMIRERQREGIAAAKAKGGVFKGRKAMLSAQQSADLIQRAHAGESKVALASAFGISRQAVYDYLRKAA